MTELFQGLISHPMFTKLAELGISLFFIFLLVRFAKLIATNNIDNKDLRYKTRKAFGLSGYVLSLIIAIVIFSNQLANLPVLIGLLGVGLGFALRELIQSLIGWAVITFGNLYKPGDRIKLGGVMGDVMDIGPLTTTVMECGDWVKSDLYNGRVVYLPNNIMLREQVQNYSVDFPFLWDEIVVPVRTDSDHRLARSILLAVGKREQGDTMAAAQQYWSHFMLHHRAEDARLDVVVTMSFDANWIEFTLRYLVDYSRRRTTKDRLFSAILDEFEKTEGRVKIAAPSVQVTEFPLAITPQA
ncbi:MAG: mechanosensitive ion channel family protein [Gammaproteobacteria bacterium]|nr:mechanosensitive ion channel family protein [Gammaproteobacteria bacterium]MBU1624080.1 mechanosensitive ion channel family protein [Gammaproteobacteria bacterium]MBU1981808.1 mechanosensitive ion channel family protein [Gammaproteobacteria bacterium]